MPRWSRPLTTRPVRLLRSRARIRVDASLHSFRNQLWRAMLFVYVDVCVARALMRGAGVHGACLTRQEQAVPCSSMLAGPYFDADVVPSGSGADVVVFKLIDSLRFFRCELRHDAATARLTQAPAGRGGACTLAPVVRAAAQPGARPDQVCFEIFFVHVVSSRDFPGFAISGACLERRRHNGFESYFRNFWNTLTLLLEHYYQLLSLQFAEGHAVPGLGHGAGNVEHDVLDLRELLQRIVRQVLASAAKMMSIK